MHDPFHVAFEIRWLFPLRGPRWKRRQLLTIWHRDPKVGGSDDSCATRWRISRAHKDRIEFAGGDEARRPWFRRERAKEPQSPTDAETLLRGALWYCARMFELDRWRVGHKRITFARCAQLASELIHNGVDNVRSSMCLLPGWHTNDRNPDGPPVGDELDLEDHEGHEREYRRPADDVRYPKEASKHERESNSTAFFFMLSRILSRETARWWQDPKWHVWHWRIQFHPWQQFKRRFIERCSACKQRYRGRKDVYSGFDGGETWCGDCQRTSAKPCGAVDHHK